MRAEVLPAGLPADWPPVFPFRKEAARPAARLPSGCARTSEGAGNFPSEVGKVFRPLTPEAAPDPPSGARPRGHRVRSRGDLGLFPRRRPLLDVRIKPRLRRPVRCVRGRSWGARARRQRWSPAVPFYTRRLFSGDSPWGGDRGPPGPWLPGANWEPPPGRAPTFRGCKPSRGPGEGRPLLCGSAREQLLCGRRGGLQGCRAWEQGSS